MSEWDNQRDFSILVGEILSSIRQEGDEAIYFTTAEGNTYVLKHIQDCCEAVSIEDVIGDLDRLVGDLILVAEEVTEEGEALNAWDESWTWTFYKLATVKDHVTIRWYGTSNGWYSESVHFIQTETANER